MGSIPWTRIPPESMVGTKDRVDYKVDSDGTVHLRGVVTLVAGAGGDLIILPAPAATAVVEPVYFGWTGAPASLNSYYSVGQIALGVFGAPGLVLDVGAIVFQGAVPPDTYAEHSLENVIAGLADALRNIVGLHVYDFPSDRIEPPAAVLSRPETPYDVTLGGRSDEWTFPLWVLTAKADDKAAYAEMLPYMEAEGPKSIRAMIEADRTLGGACDTAAVIRARPLFATVGGTEFLAVEFTLEVYT